METQKLRSNAGAIEVLEQKQLQNGAYYRLKIDGKWLSCFEPLAPQPQVGQVWAFNVKTTSKNGRNYENAIDMVFLPREGGGPISTESVHNPPPQQQQAAVGYGGHEAAKSFKDMNIVRQSSLASAARCCHVSRETVEADVELLLKVAAKFEEWVWRQ